MNDKLVTLTYCENSFEAEVAKTKLTEAGIPCFLSGNEIAAMDWAMRNAIGGIKVQVWQRDLERAYECFETSDAIDESFEAADDPGEDDPETPSELPIDEGPLEYDRVSERDEQADRALKAAILGLLFCPLQYYSAYLLSCVWFTPQGPLSPRSHRNALIAAVLCLPLVVTTFCYVLYLCLSYLMEKLTPPSYY